MNSQTASVLRHFTPRGRAARPRRQSSRFPWVSAAILVLVVFMAIFGERVTGQSSLEGSFSQSLLPPFWSSEGSSQFLLGTDTLGRDVLTRIFVGGRTTLIVGVSSVLLAGTIGTGLGLLAGFLGGKVDSVLMRITDVFLSVPVIVLGLAVATAFGPGVRNLVLVLTFITWTFYARLIRAETLRIKEMDYIRAARLCGTSTLRILREHVIRNIMNTIVVVGSLQVGYTIIVAASLSFLGLGVSSETPEWGLMLAEGQVYLESAWWISVFPGAALAATVLSANLFGDWVRNRVDPSGTTNFGITDGK